jgi:hypothetical protein
VKNYTFYWEIQTVLEQFVGAFNDVLIKRYDNQKNIVTPPNDIKVNYVYGPKQRIFNSLQNPAPGGITVPAIAVSIGGISRDQNRVANKNDGFVIPYNTTTTPSDFVKNIPQPIPINIVVNMTLITKYQNDMDQLISNFAPYCDPYIIISWKTPTLENSLVPYEIRSEVLWNGNISLQYPNDAGPTQAFRITADTSFTIKGWLFKKIDDIYKKIYVINADFSAIESNEQLLKDIDELYTETVTISARPQPNKTQPCIMLVKNEFTASEPFKINVYGKSFFDVRNIYLSASNESMFSYSSFYNPFSGIDNLKDKYPPFKGIVVPEFNLLNENYLDFTLPEYPTEEGYIDIIVENEAGYGVMTIDRKLPPVSSYPDSVGVECTTCGMSGIYVSSSF